MSPFFVPPVVSIVAPTLAVAGSALSAAWAGVEAASSSSFQGAVIDPNVSVTPEVVIQLAIVIGALVVVFKAGSLFRQIQVDTREALRVAKEVQELRSRVATLEGGEHKRKPEA